MDPEAQFRGRAKEAPGWFVEASAPAILTGLPGRSIDQIRLGTPTESKYKRLFNLVSDEQTRRRLGRPPIDHDDPSVSVSIRLPSRAYDDAYERARQAGVSLPEQLRRDLRTGTDKRTQK